MIRRWRVQPDMEEETADGMVLAVSQEALAVAVMDAVTMVHRAGGVFQVVCERYPTGLPGEMVTTGAVVEWRHRTDARPEPERTNGQPIATPAAAAAALDAQIADEAVENIPRNIPQAEVPPEDDPTQYKGGEFRDDIGDGIDPNALPEEDDSEIPETVG
jgi:hypothetical protein